MPAVSSQAVVVAHAFSSDLGWMAASFAGRRLVRLSIGHPRSVDALGAIQSRGSSLEDLDDAPRAIVELLQRYAAGDNADPCAIEIELGERTSFQRKVIQLCRRIPRGKVLSYGELAAKAGSPGAARAVGNVMRTNCIPLVIPCHRVVGSAGSLGGYSAPTGLTLKRRLLMLEGARI